MSGSRVRQIGGTTVLLLSLAACGGGGTTGPAPPQTGSIAGEVTAGGSGVAAAQVGLSGAATRSTQTNATGQYGFDNLSPGSYDLTITAPAGFALASGEAATKSAQVTAGNTARVNWGLQASSGGGPVQEIRASGVSFSPQNVTISPGTTVRWIIDNGSHTVTPDNANQAGVWQDPGLLNPGQSFEHTFTTAGTYNYHCIPHASQGMTGVIVVE